MLRAPMAVVCLLLVAGPAAATHRQTPAVIQMTTSGDNALPRVSPPGKRTFVAASGSGSNVTLESYNPAKTGSAPTTVFAGGDNANPAIDFKGKSFAWDTDDDPLSNGASGRQIILDLKKGLLFQPILDPTGTSENPALGKGTRGLVFESNGDLASAGNAGAKQVFFRNKLGLLQQVSRGVGTSRNAVISSRGDWIAFESTSHPVSGVNTGIEQIWVQPKGGVTADPITNGAGPSRNAAVSFDGRIVAFESDAALAGSGADTGLPQIYVWESRNGTFAKITSDGRGCRNPSVNKAVGDWRLSYTCGGDAYYHLLRKELTFEVGTGGGDTSRIMVGPGNHFVTLATTGNPGGGSGTSGHQIFVVNLFKQPGSQIANPVTWFPEKGLK